MSGHIDGAGNYRHSETVEDFLLLAITRRISSIVLFWRQDQTRRCGSSANPTLRDRQFRRGNTSFKGRHAGDQAKR